MNMWVFRITKGYGGGDPIGTCPVGFNQDQVQETIRNSQQMPIVYDCEVEWVLSELYQGRLRQGWGVANPNLDLKLPDNKWAQNYVVACYKYWSKNSDCLLAMGRKNILNHMLNMNVGDVIFIPKTPDHMNFMVTTVGKTYYFDHNESIQSTNFRNDFRHIVEVEKLKTYPYSANTLQASIFGAPFLHAIDHIAPHYQVYGTLQNFISNQYK